MCRLLAYLGQPISLDHLLIKPEHSLIVQSYLPREMTAGVVNADGFGIGWYHHSKETHPFVYKNTYPIWNDLNLPHLTRYVESGCVLANIRSATESYGISGSNCQPFIWNNLLFIHNGFIDNFRKTLYRPLSDLLTDERYQSIHGTTDSEHIFALFLQQLQGQKEPDIHQALTQTLGIVSNLANEYQVKFSANIVISDGQQLIISRFAHEALIPSLYWLRDDINYPNSIIITSEPLFIGDWHRFGDRSISRVGLDFAITSTFI